MRYNNHVLQIHHERRERFFTQLAAEYHERFPNSYEFHQRASRRLVDGGSHTARLLQPFPLWVRLARGAYITDVDDHVILDFWQGHFANLLGHNPPVITEALAQALHQGHGLQSGMQDVWEVELADLVCRLVGAEKVRFTTSGSLSTMYAVLLARVYTGRELVLKAGGGWHGAQPLLLKGVSYGSQGYQQAESEGLPASLLEAILVARFNDADVLSDMFRQYGDRIACFIVEPLIGAGGFIAARPEFLQAARALTEKYGALLIFDEIITGFRFHAGPLGALYGIQPDLMTLGKIMGGGMPVAAVAGRSDVLALCGKEGRHRARFEGGTYSAHPLSLQAACHMLRYIKEHEAEIYPYLGHMGARLRESARRAFESEGIPVQCAGEPSSVMSGSSLFSLHFPYQSGVSSDIPDVLNDPTRYDVELKERVLRLAFLLEGVYVMHAGGALSTAHGEEELRRMEEAYRAVAKRMHEAGLTPGG